MYVTRHNSVVEPGLVERLWVLYELSYRRTAEACATRELFFRTEFDAVLADPSNRLWVMWADEEPVAMVSIATDIGSTRYLSRAFFEQHFAEHSRRSAVHYVLFIVVHPRYVATGALARMARAVFGVEAAEGALMVFDVPQINQPHDDGGTALLVERLSNMVAAGAELIPLDVSRYYGIDFAVTSAYAEETMSGSESTAVADAVPARR